MRPAVRPKPLTCAQCGVETDAWMFNADDVERDLLAGESPPMAGWWFDDEWWIDPVRFWDIDSYCCSKFCYLLRADQNKAKP